MTASLLVPDVVCVAGRTEDYDWQIFKADGVTPEGIAVDDVVRFKVASTNGGAPVLELSSNGPTTLGSRVFVDQLGASGTTPATGRVRLAQGDTIAISGKKYFELDLVDNSEVSPADAIKPICRGVIVFWPSQSGNLGLAP
jgi:hypothetical protein